MTRVSREAALAGLEVCAFLLAEDLFSHGANSEKAEDQLVPELLVAMLSGTLLLSADKQSLQETATVARSQRLARSLPVLALVKAPLWKEGAGERWAGGRRRRE